MPITLADRAPLEKVRRLADGRLAAVAKFARSGVYRYSGAEVGRPDLAVVDVYRPASEVFDQAALASFAHKAVTLGHPSGSVTADNWKQHSVGYTEGKVARDGDFVEIPLMLADASAVRAYNAGTARELSAGYVCELTMGDGTAPNGQRYNATQRQIRGNHIALVPAGRAGSECRIGDAAAAGSIDMAWRAYLAAENINAASDKRHPQDLGGEFKRFAERYFASVGAAGLAAVGGIPLTEPTKDQAMTNDAAIECEVAFQRMAHENRFAFLGDGAPAFDEGKARFLAQQNAMNDTARSVRDAVHANRLGGLGYAPLPAITSDAQNATDAAWHKSGEDLNGWRNVRDAVRDARYR